MLTLEEKAYKMWENKAVKECPFFCVIGLDEEATAYFRGAVKVDYTTGAVEPLESYVEEGPEVEGSLDDPEEERLETFGDRPRASVRVPSQQGENVLEIKWELSRTGNPCIQRHTALEVPLIFYNMGRKRCEVAYAIKYIDFQVVGKSFGIAPASTRTEQEETLKRLRELKRRRAFYENLK